VDDLSMTQDGTSRPETRINGIDHRSSTISTAKSSFSDLKTSNQLFSILFPHQDFINFVQTFPQRPTQRSATCRNCLATMANAGKILLLLIKYRTTRITPSPKGSNSNGHAKPGHSLGAQTTVL
jgi:hypothetical protein